MCLNKSLVSNPVIERRSREVKPLFECRNPNRQWKPAMPQSETEQLSGIGTPEPDGNTVGLAALQTTTPIGSPTGLGV
jgi:hypothetical protein